MRTIYSFLTVFLLSCFMSIGAYADNVPFYLMANNDSEKNVTREHFDTPLSDSDPWTITAYTRYYGEPSHTTWGSRLFHAYLCEAPIKTSDGQSCGGDDNVNYEFTSESKLCFYMRPTVGGTDSNRGKLLLNNSAITDVLNIDTENGTEFTFQIISDGTGTVLVNIWVAGNNNGEPYTKTYTNHDIGTVYGLAAGQRYDVEGTIALGASTPILTRPADVNFRTIPLNTPVTKGLKVTGLNLIGNITGEISGEDANAFNLKTASVPNNGELEIEFTPTTKRIYETQLTLTSLNADPVALKITGQGGNLPLAISSEDNLDEHWYYIQFVRRSGEAKVWTAVAKDDTISQSVLTPGSDAQQWKVYGDWDEYAFISKTGIELSYDALSDKYIAVEPAVGQFFGFVSYKDTSDWQVQNMDFTFMNKDTSLDVPGKNYINDYQGKTVCAYNIDDSGNQIAFIPVGDEKLFAGPDSIGFGTVTIGYPSIKKYPVVKLNIPDAGVYSFNGTDAGVFSAEITADSLFITLDPKEAIDYNATLTITAGSHSHTMTLTGTGFQIPALPFKESSADNSAEYWYQIQFNRQNSKAFQDNGAGEKITQVEKVDDLETQLWKISGTWDNYKIVAKSSNEFKFDTGSSRYIAVASGEGDKFGIRFNDNDGWSELYNLTVNTTGSYINDYGGNSGSELGNYNHNDAGCKINFISTFATISAASLSFGEIEAGASFTKEMTVSSNLLESVITYTRGGADTDAFTVTVVEDETAPALDPNTIYQEGGKLRITFTPTDRRAYSATLTFTSERADPVEVNLTGTANFDLPVEISNATPEKWYTVSFKRQSAKVLAVDEFGGLAQVAKPADEPADAYQWKFTGTPADGYQVVSKTGPAIVYAPSLYGLSAEGDRHQFIRAGNGQDWQLYNLTANGSDEDGDNYRYLNDYNKDGASVALYSANDDGNYLTFTLAGGETAVKTTETANDVIVATRYYTLQGAQVKKPAQTGIYIKQDSHASGRVTATKVYFVK